MLTALFGNQNIKKILLFLFVNSKCYGTQLQRVLSTPLTPLQNALQRLENGGIITHYFEGKTKIFHFNPAYPLLEELEQLLKKAYTYLPPHEKKQYLLLKESHHIRENDQLLQEVWKKLTSIKELFFNAKTKSSETSGWQGVGRGTVTVTKEKERVLIFSEKGKWRQDLGNELDFTNIFRWTFDPQGMISLEHLRLGPQNPVFLFHLVPIQKKVLTSLDSHLCGNDSYHGQLLLDTKGIKLSWRVIGPRKNEQIDYYYT